MMPPSDMPAIPRRSSDPATLRSSWSTSCRPGVYPSRNGLNPRRDSAATLGARSQTKWPRVAIHVLHPQQSRRAGIGYRQAQRRFDHGCTSWPRPGNWGAAGWSVWSAARCRRGPRTAAAPACLSCPLAERVRAVARVVRGRG
jgi:hypothetical protein